MVHTCRESKKCAANTGDILQRLIAFEMVTIPYNQLEHVITTWHKPKSPPQCFSSFRCLTPGTIIPMAAIGIFLVASGCFTPLGANGADGFGVTGFTATQHIFEKAYGKLHGLCRLGKFMAQ